MKKIICFSVWLFSAISIGVLAAKGIVPKCTQGKFNLVVINHVSHCDPRHPHICLYNGDISILPVMCEDVVPGLNMDSNESISFYRKPSKAHIAYDAYVDGPTGKQLLFAYDHGVVSENCEEVLGTNARCVITRSVDKEHLTYTLTINKPK